MASTSSLVLYFRSLKASKVLNHLTNYLLQYKSVCVPHVGTIQLIRHSPQLNVVDKVILPPTYSFVIKDENEVTDHQLRFLHRILDKEREAVVDDLELLGSRLREKINDQGYEWKGIGLLTKQSDSYPLMLSSLEPVPAVRVLRQDAKHNVLVGDHQRTSQHGVSLQTETGRITKKRSVFIVIGWVLLLLSLLFIALYLYNEKFRVNASGSKQPPSGYLILHRDTFHS